MESGCNFKFRNGEVVPFSQYCQKLTKLAAISLFRSLSVPRVATIYIGRHIKQDQSVLDNAHRLPEPLTKVI